MALTTKDAVVRIISWPMYSSVSISSCDSEAIRTTDVYLTSLQQRSTSFYSALSGFDAIYGRALAVVLLVFRQRS